MVESDKNKCIDLLKKENQKLKKEITKLKVLAFIDTTFKCYNRNYLENIRSIILKEYSTIAILDIDNLKKINDTKGHAGGDALIQSVLDIVMVKLKNIDHKIIRLGGDEFLILAKAKKTAECFACLEASLDNASIGIITTTSHSKKPITLKSALKKADNLMYKNKRTKKAKNN